MNVFEKRPFLQNGNTVKPLNSGHYSQFGEFPIFKMLEYTRLFIEVLLCY